MSDNSNTCVLHDANIVHNTSLSIHNTGKIMENFSDRLKAIVGERFGTIVKFSEAMGVKPQTVYEVLRSNAPGYSTLEKIRQVVPDLNFNWLLFGSGEMFIDEAVNVVNESLPGYQVSEIKYVGHLEREVDYLRNTLQETIELVKRGRQENVEAVKEGKKAED